MQIRNLTSPSSFAEQSPPSSPSPSPEPTIDMAPAHHVLLLLEVQRGRLCQPPPLGVPQASEAVENIGKVLKAARAANPPPRIIHVRHAGEPGDPDDRTKPGWNLVFPPEEGEFVIDKIKNSAFADTKLPSLISRDAEVIVIGLQSDFCVRATCSAALGRGNEVLLIKGAHATYDRVEVWNGGMVTPAHKVIDEIEQELEEAGVLLIDMKALPSLFTDR